LVRRRKAIEFLPVDSVGAIAGTTVESDGPASRRRSSEDEIAQRREE
jgi:hypothetical protein